MSKIEDLEIKMESLIDEYGLEEVVRALGTICHAKADHVQSNWQDRGLAKSWAKRGMLLDQTVTKLIKL